MTYWLSDLGIWWLSDLVNQWFYVIPLFYIQWTNGLMIVRLGDSMSWWYLVDSVSRLFSYFQFRFLSYPTRMCVCRENCIVMSQNPKQSLAYMIYLHKFLYNIIKYIRLNKDSCTVFNQGKAEIWIHLWKP